MINQLELLQDKLIHIARHCYYGMVSDNPNVYFQEILRELEIKEPKEVGLSNSVLKGTKK